MAKAYAKRTPAEKRQQIVEITEKLDKELHNFMNSDKFKFVDFMELRTA